MVMQSMAPPAGARGGGQRAQRGRDQGAASSQAQAQSSQQAQPPQK